MSEISIAYDYQIFCRQRFGGISRYFYELAKQVDATEAFSAKIFALLHYNEYIRDSDVGVQGRFLERGKKSVNFYRVVNYLFSQAFLRGYEPDVVHETYFSDISLLNPKVPTVVTIHDMIHELFLEGDQLKRSSVSRKKRISADRAAHVICGSENTKRDLLNRYDISPEKISVVYYGFSSESFATEQGSPATYPYLLYVGQRGNYKNFSFFLKSYAASTSVSNSCHIVCFGGGAFSPEEEKLIKDLGIRRSVVHQLSGSDAMMAGWYRHAEAFVFPSLYEGFGIPLLEAMHYKCPIICSNASSFPEIAGEVGAFFDPTDVDDLRNRLESVLESESLKHQMVSKGIERVRDFSWERCAQETMAVYRYVAELS